MAQLSQYLQQAGTGDLTEAVRVASNRLEGATILAIHADHRPATCNSPLVGLGENELLLGSDVSVH